MHPYTVPRTHLSLHPASYRTHHTSNRVSKLALPETSIAEVDPSAGDIIRTILVPQEVRKGLGGCPGFRTVLTGGIATFLRIVDHTYDRGDDDANDNDTGDASSGVYEASLARTLACHGIALVTLEIVFVLEFPRDNLHLVHLCECM